MWTTIFGATNLVALIAWAILILLPRKPFAMAAVLYLGVALLCLAYAVVLGLLFYGDDPGPQLWIGGAMVLGGVFLIALRALAKSRPLPQARDI